ncbi:MAG: hypothetical protein NZT92_20555 [Abditibacteriales bacterium]|nr:hypothetical protein [Abditibacteriales bacterium]MDW8367166.1 hypothetical protein [Abditibacteriales bacterium]
MGISVDGVRAAVERQLSASSAEIAAVTLSAQAQRVMELAASQAQARGHRSLSSFCLKEDGGEGGIRTLGRAF